MGTAAQRTKTVNLLRGVRTRLTGFSADDVLTTEWDKKRCRHIVVIVTSNGLRIEHVKLPPPAAA
jgi:hypothetical protein